MKETFYINITGPIQKERSVQKSAKAGQLSFKKQIVKTKMKEIQKLKAKKLSLGRRIFFLLQLRKRGLDSGNHSRILRIARHGGGIWHRQLLLIRCLGAARILSDLLRVKDALRQP